jgi:N-methylhydantoinase B
MPLSTTTPPSSDAAAGSSPDGTGPLDIVSLAVMNNRVEGIARKMTNTLFRTARTTVLNTARDFSCCIVTADHVLLAMAESLPIHVLSGPDLMSRSLAGFHPVLRRGDAFLHNSPYHGNSHAGDHCIVVPVVDDDGRHRATAIVKAHMADIGNSEPNTISATFRDVYNEGALIFPCVKIQENYRDIGDIVRMCQARIRVPEDWYGDLLAMIGAARVGERELLALGSEAGWDTFDRYTDQWLAYSEQRMAAAIRELPGGRRTISYWHDPFPVPGIEDGVPLTVTVEVRNDEGTVEVDLTNNPDCLPCGINLTQSTATTAAVIGVFNSVDHSVPRNGGSGRRLRVHLRENCCVGIPRHPASCSTATSGIAERVACLVQRAISELGDGYGMAETGPECPPAVAGISGADPRRGGAPFVDMMILGNSAGAGHPHGDGWLTNGEVGDGGMMLRDSTEVIEYLRPIRIWNDRILPNTEGPGRFRGAPSLLVEYEPVGTEIQVMYSADGCVYPAMGARGGLPGAVTRPYKRTSDGKLEPQEPWGDVTLKEGETMVSVSSGGGGYGPPCEREIERVRKDVAEGWITADRARSVYGVVLSDDGVADIAATERERAVMRERGTPASAAESEEAILEFVARAAPPRRRSGS